MALKELDLVNKIVTLWRESDALQLDGVEETASFYIKRYSATVVNRTEHRWATALRIKR